MTTLTGVMPGAAAGQTSPHAAPSFVRNIATIAGRELRDAVRSRWFVLYTLAFAVLGLGISYVAAVGAGGAGLSGFGRTTAGLINLVLLVVPLMALTAGAGSITNYAGLTPARQAWLEARRAKARQPADGTEPRTRAASAFCATSLRARQQLVEIDMLSHTVEYALRAMMHLAALEPGSAANSESVAASTQVPQGYLSKILRDLVVAELISSQRGPNGGFSLARPADRITMLDVVNAVDPIERIRKCPLSNPAHLNLCPLHERIDNAIGLIERQFRETSLAEILESKTKAGAQCRSLMTPTRDAKPPKPRAVS